MTAAERFRTRYAARQLRAARERVARAHAELTVAAFHARQVDWVDRYAPHARLVAAQRELTAARAALTRMERRQ